MLSGIEDLRVCDPQTPFDIALRGVASAPESPFEFVA